MDSVLSYWCKNYWLAVKLAMTLMVLATFSPIASAREQGSAPLTSKGLEASVWNASDDELPRLEKIAVRRLQENPDSAFDHYILSHLYLRLFLSANDRPNWNAINYLQDALDLAQQSLALNASSEIGYVAIADILEVMGEDKKASAMLDRAPQGRQNSWRVLFARTRAKAEKLLPATTLSSLVTILKDRDVNEGIVTPFLIGLLDVGYSDEIALEKVEELRKAGITNHQLRMFAGQMLINLERPIDAAHHFKEMLRGNEAPAQARLQLAVVHYSLMKKHSSALKMLKSVISSLEANSKHLEAAQLHYALAMIADGKKDRQARRVLIRLLNGRRDRLSALLPIVISQYQKYNKNIQLAHFLRRLTEDGMSGSAFLHALLGDTYARSLAQFSEAISSYKRALVLDPQNSRTHNAIGVAFYEIQNYQTALHHFDTAQSLDPQDSVAAYNKACMLALLGKNLESVDALKRAIDLDPTLRKVAASDKDFQRIRKSAQFKDLILRYHEISQNN